MAMGGTIIRSEPGMIPWTAVQMWIDRHGLSDDDAALLDHCIMAMDSEFKKWWQEHHKVKDGQ